MSRGDASAEVTAASVPVSSIVCWALNDEPTVWVSVRPVVLTLRVPPPAGSDSSAHTFAEPVNSATVIGMTLPVCPAGCERAGTVTRGPVQVTSIVRASSEPPLPIDAVTSSTPPSVPV